MKEFRWIYDRAKDGPDDGASGHHPGMVAGEPREFRAQTLGGHLELISEFEVRAGGEVHPHSHPTYEFYYMISGRAVMTVDGESAEVGPGDLINIPPLAVHSIRPISPHTAFVRWPSALRSRVRLRSTTPVTTATA